MKRTISEVIDLIKQKKESAERTLIKLTNDLSPETLPFREKEEKFIARNVGYVEAYTDILALLESSHLIEQEKVLDIFKKHLTINFGEKVFGDNSVIIKEKISSINSYLLMFVNEEEKKVLEEVLKDNE